VVIFSFSSSLFFFLFLAEMKTVSWFKTWLFYYYYLKCMHISLDMSLLGSHLLNQWYGSNICEVGVAFLQAGDDYKTRSVINWLFFIIFLIFERDFKYVVSYGWTMRWCWCILEINDYRVLAILIYQECTRRAI